MKNLKLMLIAIVASVSFLGAAESDDITNADIQAYKEYMDSQKLSDVTVELSILMKQQIKETPHLDEATKIVNSELMSTDLIKNTLVIDLNVIKEVLKSKFKKDIDVNSESFLNGLAENLSDSQKRRMCLYDPFSKIVLEKGVKYSYLYLIKDTNDLLIQFDVTKDICSKLQ